MRSQYLLIILCVLALISFVSALGTPTLVWDNSTGAINNTCITAIDTNSAGSMVIVGYGDGNITAYSTTDNLTVATPLWTMIANKTPPYQVRGIKKLVADANGDVAWISNSNGTGVISSSGAVASWINNTGRNITDVAISPDGVTFAITELYPSRITIYHANGSIHAQNTSFNGANWTKIAYDPANAYILTSNQSDPYNRSYFWNVTSWTGWEQFNTYHTASKNSSQIFLDTFPYRENFSFSAGDSANSNRIWMYNVSNVTTPIKISNGYYFYNGLTTGRYYYFTIPGNLSNNQTTMLNISYSDLTQSVYVIRPGFPNVTMYYGNLSYGYGFLNQTWGNNNTIMRTNLTSGTTTWTAPTGVYAVNISMYGGGGAGASGAASTGDGGDAAALNTYTNVPVTPGNTYSVSIGAGGSPSGAAGGTSSFSNDGAAKTATGGAGGSGVGVGTGGAGNTSILGYPTATTGASGSRVTVGTPYDCPGGTTAGGAGGSGYGAGGGGGGYRTYYYVSCEYAGAGGAGAPGVIQLNYYVNDQPTYYYGEIAASHANASVQTIQVGDALNQSSSKDYSGSILGYSVPSTGGIVSMITSDIFYQQYMYPTGFDLLFCATNSITSLPLTYPGTPLDVKASNGGTASIEGRGQYGVVYDPGAIGKASSLTGGTIRSVDSSMSSGTLAAFGGDEGKIYMLSREGSSTWYSYYTGTSGYPISSVAMSWDGQYVFVGRTNGLLEFFNTSVSTVITATPTSGVGSSVDASLIVYKDSAPYINQPVTIYSSASYPYTWVPVATSATDGSGKMTYTTTVGTYYKFVVNNIGGTTSGEGEKIWQSNAASTTVQIYIVSASTPYEWNAYYTTSTNNVTVVYSDTVTPTNVRVEILDLKTNLQVLSRTYTSTPSFTLEYHDQLGNGSYQVNILINRMGMTVRDQRIVTSPNTYGTILPADNYIVWAISTVVLMLIAGMFSYSNSKRGALAVVVIAVVMMIFKLLPWGMVTVAMLAALFAVMSLFASRVQ